MAGVRKKNWKIWSTKKKSICECSISNTVLTLVWLAIGNILVGLYLGRNPIFLPADNFLLSFCTSYKPETVTYSSNTILIMLCRSVANHCCVSGRVIFKAGLLLMHSCLYFGTQPKKALLSVIKKPYFFHILGGNNVVLYQCESVWVLLCWSCDKRLE